MMVSTEICRMKVCSHQTNPNQGLQLKSPCFAKPRLPLLFMRISHTTRLFSIEYLHLPTCSPTEILLSIVYIFAIDNLAFMFAIDNLYRHRAAIGACMNITKMEN